MPSREPSPPPLPPLPPPPILLCIKLRVSACIGHGVGATYLKHHLHDSLRGTGHCFLLVSRSRSTLRVEELGCLGHSHRQNLRLHIPSTTASTSTSTTTEHLKSLHGSSSSHSLGAKAGSIPAAVGLAVSVLYLTMIERRCRRGLSVGNCKHFYLERRKNLRLTPELMWLTAFWKTS